MHFKQLKHIGCVADVSSELAFNSHNTLLDKYHLIDLNSDNHSGCDAIIALGGDGLMLKVLHRFMYSGIPIFGMNRGSVGFLMNNYNEELLMHRIAHSVPIHLFPLEMVVETNDGQKISHVAINEVSLLRQTIQSAKLRIIVNGERMMEELVCDGLMVATPAGSTAYNIAANGPILPLGANLLAMTPICAFRPRRWKGALLANDSKIEIEILDPEKRPVSASADFFEVRDVKKVTIQERRDANLIVLFDKNNSLEDRILKEQFMS
jgi:NAD+ kinase